jgi:seryl-tRNA synthetase
MLNDFYNKFKTFSISPRILELPFLQLEKWRKDAHQKLDQLAEQKRQEIQQKISEYQIQFTKKTNEQKQKIEILIKHLNDLSRQTQIANKDIKYLEEKIIETKNFFQSIEKHSIKVSTYCFSVNIRTNFF